MASADGYSIDVARPRASVVAALAGGEIAGLDGLRALSVLAVMFAHFGFGHIVPGGLGVTVFFFISGFLITTLMLREAHATGGVAIGRFYARRLLRLQPELWGLLVVSGIGGILINHWPTVLDVTSGVFYLSNYAKIGTFTGGILPDMRWPQLWSLAVEEHYYLTYPLLFVALIRMPKRLAAVLLAVLVGALALRFGYYFAGADTDAIYSATETRIDSIAYGCIGALGLWYLPEDVARFISRNRTALAVFAIVVLCASITLRDAMFRDTLRYSMQGMALLILSASLYIGSPNAIGIQLLENPMLKWMGRMSYGAYLWHLEVGSLFERSIGMELRTSPSVTAALLALTLVVLSFGAAWVSFVAFQRPVAALRHRFGADPRAPIAGALADAMPDVKVEPVPVKARRRR
jgi:peptidoglycan/LPS O-acetylase OafA/YrhL